MAEATEKKVEVTGQQEKEKSISRRGYYSPLLFSLTPRDLFTLNPFEMMRRFSEEMDRTFENFGLWRGFTKGETGWAPAIEVFERKGKFVVRAELPGLSKDDVKVELTDDSLIIKGERKSEHKEEGKGFYRSELSYGSFYREILIPESATVDQTEAKFSNGVLEVVIPVPESVRKRREVPIKEEAAQQAQAATKI
ncbi:MAG: Hsp20/alpha crystallin family protein [Acidobacteriota bacterium]